MVTTKELRTNRLHGLLMPSCRGGVRVGLVVGLHHPADRNASVYLRGRQPGMPQERRYALKRRAVIVHVRPTGVA